MKMRSIIPAILVFSFCDARLNGTNLIDLGLKINNALIEANGPVIQLVEDVLNYNDELDCVRQDMKVGIAYTFELFLRLKNIGGPQYTHCRVNASYLASSFGWEYGEEFEFLDLIEDTRKEWEKLIKEYNKTDKKYLNGTMKD